MPSAIRWDWQQIKGQGDNYLALFVIPEHGAALLRGVMHRLEWASSYDVNGYDYSDYDHLQNIVAQTWDGLNNPMSISQVINALEGIKTAIDAQRLVMTAPSACCGDSVTPIPPVDVGSGDVPQAVQGLGFTDWQDYDEYLCAALQTVVDAVREIVQKWKLIAVSGAATAGALAAVASFLGPLGWAFGVTIAAAAAVWIVILESGDTAVFDAVDNWLDLNRVQIACELKGETSAQGMLDAWKSTNEGLPALQRTVLNNAVSPRVFEAVLNGADGDGNVVQLRYSGGECGTCGQVSADFVTYVPNGTMNAPTEWGGVGLDNRVEDGFIVNGGNDVGALGFDGDGDVWNNNFLIQHSFTTNAPSKIRIVFARTSSSTNQVFFNLVGGFNNTAAQTTPWVKQIYLSPSIPAGTHTMRIQASTGNSRFALQLIELVPDV